MNALNVENPSSVLTPAWSQISGCDDKKWQLMVNHESFEETLSRRLSRSMAQMNGEKISVELLTPREDPVERWEKWAATNRVSPESRENSVGVIHKDYLVVFGGCGGSRGKERSDFVFRRNLKHQSCMWEKMKCEGISPPPTSSGTGTLVRDEMWVYGGENQFHDNKGKGKSRDVHGNMFALHLDTFVWRPVTTKGTLSTNFLNPMPKRGHTTTFVAEGSFRKARILSPPVGLTATRAPRMRDVLLSFGGSGPEESFNVDRYNNDLYVLDMSTLEWHLARVEGDVPSPRSMHTTTLVPRKGLFVYGGITASISPVREGPMLDKMAHSMVKDPIAPSDVFMLQLPTKTTAYTWTKLKTSGRPPPPRYGHSAALNEANDFGKVRYIYYYGGRLASTLEPQNSVYVFDIRSKPATWSTARTAGMAPSARFLHVAAVYNGSTMVVYGGSNYQTYTNGDIYFLAMSDQTRTPGPKKKVSLSHLGSTSFSHQSEEDRMSVALLPDCFVDSGDDEMDIDSELLHLSGRSSYGTISMLRAQSPKRERQRWSRTHGQNASRSNHLLGMEVTFNLNERNALRSNKSAAASERPASAIGVRRSAINVLPMKKKSSLHRPSTALGLRHSLSKKRPGKVAVSNKNGEGTAPRRATSQTTRPERPSTALGIRQSARKTLPEAAPTPRLEFPSFEQLQKSKMIMSFTNQFALSPEDVRRKQRRALSASSARTRGAHERKEEEKDGGGSAEDGDVDIDPLTQTNSSKRRFYTGMYNTPKPVKIRPPPQPIMGTLKKKLSEENALNKKNERHVRGFVPYPVPKRNVLTSDTRKQRPLSGLPSRRSNTFVTPVKKRPQTAGPRLRRRPQVPNF